jgi:L-ascorbate metabolism protein UlaG (beta-lactamase superfamily)
MKFRNLDGSGPNDLGAVFRWAVLDRLSGRRRPDRRPVEVPRTPNDGSALRGNVSDAAVCWVGHATWLVQLAGTNAVVDPIWARAISGVVPRRSAPGVAVADLPRVDVVLVTHNHRDHMDAPSLRALSHAPVCVVPLGLGPSLRALGFRRVVELGWWEHTQVGGMRITLVPSQHWSRRGLDDTNDTLWGGYVMEGGGRRVYHTGDTAYFDGFREIAARMGAPDAALLPIGAYDPEWFMRRQHMNPEDALKAGADLDARMLLAMHWGTYQLTDEPLDEPPRLFLEQAARDVRLLERTRVVPIGGVVTL